MFAFDTNILVWGVRQEPAADRPDMVQRCIDLIQDCKQRRLPMMVPSVVVAEYLIGYGQQDQQRQREIIGRHFYIAPFDAKCAAIAAELFEKLEFDRLKQENNVGRQCLKIDYKVVATAIAQGVSCLFTDDDHMRVIGKGKLLVKEVPELGFYTRKSDDKPPPRKGPQSDLDFPDDDL